MLWRRSGSFEHERHSEPWVHIFNRADTILILYRLISQYDFLKLLQTISVTELKFSAVTELKFSALIWLKL